MPQANSKKYVPNKVVESINVFAKNLVETDFVRFLAVCFLYNNDPNSWNHPNSYMYYMTTQPINN